MLKAFDKIRLGSNEDVGSSFGATGCSQYGECAALLARVGYLREDIHNHDHEAGRRRHGSAKLIVVIAVIAW